MTEQSILQSLSGPPRSEMGPSSAAGQDNQVALIDTILRTNSLAENMAEELEEATYGRRV